MLFGECLFLLKLVSLVYKYAYSLFSRVCTKNPMLSYALKAVNDLYLFPSVGWLLAKPAVGTRTYGWLHWCRRLNVDYERLPACSEAFIHIAMIRLVLRRLA